MSIDQFLIGPKCTWTVDESYRYCELLARSHYENFTVGSLFLPRGRYRHMCAVYGYCRGVDDLGDEARGDRLDLLHRWRQELGLCYDGKPSHPVMVALQQTIHAFDIPQEPFLKLISANQLDQTKTRYASYTELLQYCDHSANPVGHLVLYLFGYRDEVRQRLADCTSTALQLTNFWQDVARDYTLGRVYIPLEDMERFGYSEEDLACGVVNECFREMIAFEVERARALFIRGVPLLSTIRGIARLDVALFTRGGIEVLKTIRAQRYDVLNHRPALSRWRKVRLLLSALARFVGPGRSSISLSGTSGNPSSVI
jgi:squalene synthase HpnC